MVATVVMNPTNVVQDGLNNKLEYNFPNSVSFPNHEIAIQSINMFYSWQNVNNTTLNNNVFYYAWPNNASATPPAVYNANFYRWYWYAVVIPPGLYELSDINKYLQWTFINNGHYGYNGAGENVYFIELVLNTSEYAVQVNTFNLILPTGFTAAEGFGSAIAGPCPGFTTTDITVIEEDKQSGYPPLNFGNLVGLPGFITPFTNTPSLSTFTAGSWLSTVAPQIQPNPVLYVSLSNIENKYASPSTIIGVVSPQVAFGELIVEVPPQFAWNKLFPGTYNGLRLSLTASNSSQIEILDPNITIVLVIRDRSDINVKDILGQQKKF
jgi:hypothetical protein